jgi:hypothetical protein
MPPKKPKGKASTKPARYRKQKNTGTIGLHHSSLQNNFIYLFTNFEELRARVFDYDDEPEDGLYKYEIFFSPLANLGFRYFNFNFHGHSGYISALHGLLDTRSVDPNTNTANKSIILLRKDLQIFLQIYSIEIWTFLK